MSDLIDRQDAIDRINGTGYADQIKNNLIFILRMLPAAQPKQADDLISRADALAYPISWENYDKSHRDTKFVCGVESYREYIEYLPSAQPKQGEWIPCDERLPEVGHDVMFSVADMYSAEGCLRDDGDWCQFRWSAIIPKDRVIAWMPLPQPYQTERSEDERIEDGGENE